MLKGDFDKEFLGNDTFDKHQTNFIRFYIKQTIKIMYGLSGFNI